MRLTGFEVSEFRSVRSSNRVTVNDITCLVGKNESGKSALLQALYRLNPVVSDDGRFDVTDDYPRMDVEDYRQDVEEGRRQVATPIQAWFDLDDEEVAVIEADIGKCLRGRSFKLNKNYENKRIFTLDVDQVAAVRHLVEAADLAQGPRDAVSAVGTDITALITVLGEQEQTSEVKTLAQTLSAINKAGLDSYILDHYIEIPKFLYFDEYYQMRGHENIEALTKRQATNNLRPSDHPMLGLIKLARLELPDLLNPDRTVNLRNKLEAAGNHLSKNILKYWSQNRHLKMSFDVRPARPGDPEGMQDGTNIWGGVYDNRHSVTTELGSRSRGFVWFFSFLAWYSDVKKQDGNLILLLDEPGLTLHGKAQADLLRYFEEELKDEHQVIYTTHSPFLVDPRHFDRVRIVQDLSIDTDDDLPVEQQGTKVLENALGATEDSLFPLQGALGYEIQQTLFVGPNSLIVEGVSDLLYLQTMSAILGEEGRTELDERWTITPVGGAAKVPTFVALLGAQKGMKVATLLDIQGKDLQMIEDLQKKSLLKKKNVLTYGQFIGQKEADVEDMLGQPLYLNLVNAEYGRSITKPVEEKDLNEKLPRVLKRLEAHFQASPLKSGRFSHLRPAKFFASNLAAIKGKIPEEAKDRFEEAFQALNALL